MRGYSQQSASANGTGTIMSAYRDSQGVGNMYYWNRGGHSALIEAIHNPDPTGDGPWIVHAVITALTLQSGMVALPTPLGYVASRSTIYSGGGNTGLVNTFFEMR